VARTKDSAVTELVIAHAAMRFIAAKGLMDEFYTSGALVGSLCGEGCSHPADMMSVRQVLSEGYGT